MRKYVDRASSRRGFTLTEVLIAVAVFATVVAVLFSLQLNSLQVTSASKATSDALQLAVAQFENVKAVITESEATYDDYVTCESVDWSDASACRFQLDGSNDVLVTPDGFEARSWIVGYPFPGAGYVTVEVEVTGERLGSPFVFRQLVSCLDTDPTPTVSSQGVCAADDVSGVYEPLLQSTEVPGS